MAKLELYNYDTHLNVYDSSLFARDDRSHEDKSRLAAEDVSRQLYAMGYEDGPESLLNEFAYAAVELSFTADDVGALTVPEGTLVSVVDPTCREFGGIRFVTDEELIVPVDSTATVTATAEYPGIPGNVRSDTLVYLIGDALVNFSAVTNVSAAIGGVDDQLTRAATYRALELIYAEDAMSPGDDFDHKRSIFAKRYKEELALMRAAGLRKWDVLEGIGDTIHDVRSHGLISLSRG